MKLFNGLGSVMLSGLLLVPDGAGLAVDRSSHLSLPGVAGDRPETAESSSYSTT